MIDTEARYIREYWSCPESDGQPFRHEPTWEVTHGPKQRAMNLPDVQGGRLSPTTDDQRAYSKIAREGNPRHRSRRSGAGVKQADLDEGRRSDGLTTDGDASSMLRLKRENKRLQGWSGPYLKKAAAWFPSVCDSIPSGVSPS